MIRGAFGVGWQVRQSYGDALDGDMACSGGLQRAVGPSALACFRVDTEQTAWEPVYELLVQALRDD